MRAVAHRMQCLSVEIEITGFAKQNDKVRLEDRISLRDNDICDHPLFQPLARTVKRWVR